MSPNRIAWDSFCWKFLNKTASFISKGLFCLVWIGCHQGLAACHWSDPHSSRSSSMQAGHMGVSGLAQCTSCPSEGSFLLPQQFYFFRVLNCLFTRFARTVDFLLKLRWKKHLEKFPKADNVPFVKLVITYRCSGILSTHQMTKMPMATVAAPMLSQKLCQAELLPMVISPRGRSSLTEGEAVCVCVHTEMRYMLVFMCVHIYVLMCTFICRWVCTSVCIHLHAYELSFVVYTSVCAYT